MTDRRRLIVQQIAERVDGIVAPHPVRVGIDGIDCSGKTTLADELRAAVDVGHRPVVRASADGFHRPRSFRYRRGAESPDGYYRDSFDHDAMRRWLLDPLGPAGNRLHRTAVFDHFTDRPVEAEAVPADPDTVLIVDGVFLHAPRLRGAWELTVWVDVEFPTSLRRALARDVPRLGSIDEVRVRYLRRYHPGQRLYLAECKPQDRADLVMVNDDPDHPMLQGAFGPGGPSG